MYDVVKYVMRELDTTRIWSSEYEVFSNIILNLFEAGIIDTLSTDDEMP